MNYISYISDCWFFFHRSKCIDRHVMTNIKAERKIPLLLARIYNHVVVPIYCKRKFLWWWLNEAQIFGYMRMPLESFHCFVLLAEEYHLVYPKYPVYLVSGFGHPSSVGCKQHSKGLYRSEPDRIPKLREGNGHKPRSLTQKLFPIHNHPPMTN